MLTIFVTNYWQLFTLRLLTGIALGGGAAPAVLPLIHNQPRPRGRAPRGQEPCLQASAVCTSPHEHPCAVVLPATDLVGCRFSSAGALPIVFSLLGDLYDPSSRAGVSSIVQLSTGLGLAVGQGIAGFVGEGWWGCDSAGSAASGAGRV